MKKFYVLPFLKSHLGFSLSDNPKKASKYYPDTRESFRLIHHNIVLTILILIISLSSYSQAVQPGDWSTVRLYGHAFNLNDFSATEYNWIKNHYSLFTIEKRHARYIYGDVSSERASVATAAKIITNNSNAKPLFYFNANNVYSSIYETIQAAILVHPEWTNSTGGNWTYEDPAFCTWFVDVVKDQVNNQGHSGVFLDAAMTLENNSSGSAAVKAKFFNMLDQMPGIRIYNGYTPRGTSTNPVVGATTDFMQHADGVFVEHFFRSHCQYLSQGKLLMDKLLAVPSNKIIIANAAPDVNWNATDHKFSLAAFLIIANDNSYYRFFANDTYSELDLMYWHEDFGKYLGAPQSVASVNGYIYTRSFENATVTVNLENKTSSIVWGTLSRTSFKENSAIVLIYPNPTSTSFSLTQEVKEVKVFDALGKEILSYDRNQSQYDISKLSKGIYMLKIILLNGNIKVNKLIKE